MVTQVSNIIKENIADTYVFVRYMGPKFVIAFSGVNIESVADFLNDIKATIENTVISLKDENGEIIKNQQAKPILNFALATYYKGTGLEKLLKNLEEYLDKADKNESEITNI